MKEKNESYADKKIRKGSPWKQGRKINASENLSFHFTIFKVIKTCMNNKSRAKRANLICDVSVKVIVVLAEFYPDDRGHLGRPGR